MLNSQNSRYNPHSVFRKSQNFIPHSLGGYATMNKFNKFCNDSHNWIPISIQRKASTISRH